MTTPRQPDRAALRNDERGIALIIALFLTAALCAVPLVLATAASAQGNAAGGADPKMSFFITSAGSGKGADLNGLAGADAICQTLATKVGSKKRWHAYLSTQASGGQKAINARDRIGKGPWRNIKGDTIASSVAAISRVCCASSGGFWNTVIACRSTTQ